MTASLFESHDSAQHFLKDTATQSVMSIELNPLQSLDGLLGEECKSSPRGNDDEVEYTMDLKSCANGSPRVAPALKASPPQPTKATRSASEADRFMKKMINIMKATAAAAAEKKESVVPALLPPLPIAGRKRNLSELTMDSREWSNLESMEHVNYADVFRTQESAVPSEKPKPFETPTPSETPKPSETPTPSETPKKERIYCVPTKNDVLCGKGGRSNNNPGNQRYLKLKDAMQDEYLKAQKNEKKTISQKLVDIVNKKWKSRFLKQETTAGPEELWYELDNETARKKCSQALREINTPVVRAAKRARYADK